MRSFDRNVSRVIRNLSPTSRIFSTHVLITSCRPRKNTHGNWQKINVNHTLSPASFSSTGCSWSNRASYFLFSSGFTRKLIDSAADFFCWRTLTGSAGAILAVGAPGAVSGPKNGAGTVCASRKALSMVRGTSAWNQCNNHFKTSVLEVFYVSQKKINLLDGLAFLILSLYNKSG